jgi:hypothetical protein
MLLPARPFGFIYNHAAVVPLSARRLPHLPLAVRRENVILCRHRRMAREAAIDGARGIRIDLLLSFSMRKTSCKTSHILAEKGASVLFFDSHSIFAILDSSGKTLPLPGTPAR